MDSSGIRCTFDEEFSELEDDKPISDDNGLGFIQNKIFFQGFV